METTGIHTQAIECYWNKLILKECMDVGANVCRRMSEVLFRWIYVA